MSTHSDKAAERLARSLRGETDGIRTREVARAQVYALLDLADAVREHTNEARLARLAEARRARAARS